MPLKVKQLTTNYICSKIRTNYTFPRGKACSKILLSSEELRLKKVKRILITLVVLTILSALLLKGYEKNAILEETEFLFDTVCTITVYERGKEDAIKKAFSESEKIHTLADFFDSNSDVSRINQAKMGEEVRVSSHIIEMIDIANKVREKSNGAFDITIAPITGLWKFDAESPIPPQKEEVLEALRMSKREVPQIDKEKSTVKKAYSETKIDLGGVAKGYAADMAAKVLLENGVKSAIIDFGGNIVLLGKNPKSADGIWKIGLQKPFAQIGEYGEVLEIQKGAVVTSGIYERFFEYEGEIFHHIIDPNTGYPKKQSFDSVTVLGESSCLSDCIATAAYVLGKEEGEKLAKEFGAKLYFLDKS